MYHFLCMSFPLSMGLYFWSALPLLLPVTRAKTVAVTGVWQVTGGSNATQKQAKTGQNGCFSLLERHPCAVTIAVTGCGNGANIVVKINNWACSAKILCVTGNVCFPEMGKQKDDSLACLPKNIWTEAISGQ